MSTTSNLRKWNHATPADLCSGLLQRADLGQRGNRAKRQIWIRIKKDFPTGRHIHKEGEGCLVLWAPEGARGLAACHDPAHGVFLHSRVARDSDPGCPFVRDHSITLIRSK